MRWDTYLKTAQKITIEFKGDSSLPLLLKQYFRNNKKHGSTDRRCISDMVFSYYRLGRNWMQDHPEKRLAIGFYLFSHEAKKAANWFYERYEIVWHESKDDRLKEIEKKYGNMPFYRTYDTYKSQDLIALEETVPTIVEPLFWLHIRPSKWKEIIYALQEKKIDYITHETYNVLAFKDVKSYNQFIQWASPYHFLIQDWSTISLLQNLGEVHEIWDACAGSGGKALGIAYRFPKAKIFASDIRKSIIHKLHERAEGQNINSIFTQIYDLKELPQNLLFSHRKNREKIYPTSFSQILLDAPCTGSGTWRREPEKAFFFQIAEISRYGKLQAELIRILWPYLDKQGYFDYVTCSVFQMENEDKIKLFEEIPDAQLISTNYYFDDKGKSNTLFHLRVKKVV